jgi:hypothetical protein
VSGEPDARKRARPVREGAVGFPWQQGAGRLPHLFPTNSSGRGFKRSSLQPAQTSFLMSRGEAACGFNRCVAGSNLAWEPLRSAADFPTQQLTDDAERETSRRRSFLGPCPQVFTFPAHRLGLSHRATRGVTAHCKVHPFRRQCSPKPVENSPTLDLHAETPSGIPDAALLRCAPWKTRQRGTSRCSHRSGRLL